MSVCDLYGQPDPQPPVLDSAASEPVTADAKATRAADAELAHLQDRAPKGGAPSWQGKGIRGIARELSISLWPHSVII